MALARYSVFLDFDGTIATADTGVVLLEELAPRAWREVEELYKSGQIGSRECMTRQWELLPHNREAIERVVRAVPIDPALGPLVSFLQSAGAEVTIVSDGYGFRAAEVGRQAGVPVLTNMIDWDAHRVVFRDTPTACPCSACGTCKRSPIEAARARDRRSVLVGDGASDAKAAEVADIVFAKDELAYRCEKGGIPYQRFATLRDVLDAMTRWSKDPPASEHLGR